jgi:hypothetical protein
MRAAMIRLGDAMLGRILPAGEAGACGACSGHPCKCAAPCGLTYCTQYYFNCYCDCVATGHC